MARTISLPLLLLPLLCMATSITAKNWRYWPNIGCYEFSFERTVFFEMTNEATRLSAPKGSQLRAIVNSTIVPSPDNRLQHILAGSIRNSTTNTPEECITSCNSTGFAYAGLQDGVRCVCTNEHPTVKTSGDKCNIGCSGDSTFSCGGRWVMDVHQNPAYHSSNLTYIGCFRNTFDSLDRMLFEGTYNNFRNNTPEWCVSFCTEGGYDYAGLQYASQCICTNSGPVGIADESQCTYGCAGDSSVKMCGGLEYINIFHTDAHKTTIDEWGCGRTIQDTYYQKWYQDMGHCNASDTRVNRMELNGECFVDTSSRLLKHQNNFSGVTPDTCYEYCTGKDYKYSGVENGNECFCGNTKPSDESRAPDSECQACGGDPNQKCGGAWRINIRGGP